MLEPYLVVKVTYILFTSFLGIIYPFLIGIPSAIRYWYRELKYYRKNKQPSTPYDSIWFEGQATRWGHKNTSEEII